MLKIEDLEVSYGAVQALRGISMEVNDGEIVSLIGANGAGKTTTLHAITGLVPIKSGSVIYDGHDLRKTDPSRIVTMGLAHVPEGRQVFTRMTVAENLAMGAYFRKDKKAIADDLERVYARFPRLKERAKPHIDNALLLLSLPTTRSRSSYTSVEIESDQPERRMPQFRKIMRIAKSRA